MKKTYAGVVEFLYSQLPQYQRDGAAAYKPDIGNIVSLCSILDNPHTRFRSVHIAGTNGKGSVAHMLASVCAESGKKVGLYTSPHLTDFRERIKINGKMIPETEVIEFVHRYHDRFKKIEPSFFEWTVALAFYYFAREKVDLAVIETGLGGRLDSTNIITPEVSVITSISMDHMAFLGNTIRLIAKEKAGIIKDAVPLVIGKLPDEAEEEVRLIAAEKNAQVINYRENAAYESDLKGNWQIINSQIVGSVCKILGIDERHIKAGIGSVVKNTGLRGRWEKISDKPLTICDIGHNEEAIRNITEQIETYTFDKLRMVIGFVSDKDLTHILTLLPVYAKYYVCSPDIRRALPAQELYDKLTGIGMDAEVYGSCKLAYEAALRESSDRDFIYIGGSTFVLSEILQ